MLAHSEDLIKNYVINLVKISNKDLEDFSDNPMEFIRRMKDVTETFYSSRHSALEFILIFYFTKCKVDENSDYLAQFLDDIAVSLQTTTDYKLKDAMLNIIQGFALLFKSHPEFNSKMEEILKNIALPALTGKDGFEKYRALKLYEQFTYLPFENEHLCEAAEQIFNRLEDPEMAVRVTAAITLFRMVKKPELKENFRAILGKLFEVYLQIISDIDSEELVSALEQLVSTFSDSIEPYALQLCENLELSFWKLINADDDDDNFGESGLAALT